MQSITIHKSGTGADTLQIDSHGNGAAYAVQFGDLTGPMRSLWFDGDDAAQLREDLDAREAAKPDEPTRDVWFAILDSYL